MSSDGRRRGPAVLFDWQRAFGRAIPLVPADIERGRHRLQDTMVLIDSGADVSVMPLELARRLGIELRSLRRAATAGIGGGATSWIAEGAGIVARIGIYRIALPRVDFIEHAPAILGRDALFGPMELRMNRDEIELRAIEAAHGA